jgi:hypothetical protein
VEHLEATLKATATELDSTKDSLFRKDQELLKLSASKLTVSGNIPLGRGEPGDQMDHLLGANRANQRLIDQLNTKVCDATKAFDVLTLSGGLLERAAGDARAAAE